MQQQPVPPPIPQMASGSQSTSQFTYQGTWQELFVVVLIHGVLLSTITLGIYYPWAYCQVRKTMLENTYCEGRRLTFVGSGSELFMLMLVHFFLLTIITLGIYQFLMIPMHKLIEFDTRNTRFME